MGWWGAMYVLCIRRRIYCIFKSLKITVISVILTEISILDQDNHNFTVWPPQPHTAVYTTHTRHMTRFTHVTHILIALHYPHDPLKLFEYITHMTHMPDACHVTHTHCTEYNPHDPYTPVHMGHHNPCNSYMVELTTHNKKNRYWTKDLVFCPRSIDLKLQTDIAR